MHLKKYKLKDICTKITDGSHYSPKERPSGYPMFSVKDMDDFCFSYDNVKRVSKEDFDILKKNGCVPQINDVLVAKDGSYLKEAFVCQEEKEEAILSSIAIFRPNTSLVDPYYLSYLFKTPFVFNYVTRGCVSGTALPRIVLQAFKEIDLYLPSLSEQKKISSILSSYDRKIALNRAINKNLEALAKQIYDYWFIQFDFPDENGRPYKSSGGKMSWNDKLNREIPSSWQANIIENVAEVFNGATPSTEEEDNYGGEIVWITPKDLSTQQSKFVYKGERNISQKGYSSCSTHLLPVNSILMSSRAPIGLLAIAKKEVCTNQGFKSFVPKSANITTYLYYYLKRYMRQVEQLGSGTTFKEVSREDILKYAIVKPDDAILDAWEGKVSVINNKQFLIQKETENLIKQRDELLPLLMNGQVTIE